MLLITFLVPLIVLATRVMASPTANPDLHPRISFPISRRINDKGEIDLIQRDGEHGKSSGKDGQLRRSTPKLAVTDTSVIYEINVDIGVPANPYSLIIDVAGANTWVGAQQTYQPTSSSVKTGDTVHVQYTSSAYLDGVEYTDTLTFAPGFDITQQSIGVANPNSPGVEGIYPLDGMLGLGPRILSIGSLSPDTSTAIPTVTDNLFTQGKIPQNLVALSFGPMLNASSSEPTTAGAMTFGDTDPTNYTGEITYFPTTTTSPANKYWGVDASLKYGNEVILNTAACVIDTITNLILIETNAYKSYVSVTGGILDPGTGLLNITSAQYETLESLFVVVGNTTYEITKNAQVFPRSWNKYIGGSIDSIYLIVQDISFSRLPAGISIVLGRAFLERFYVVLDSGNSSVGFATTQFTNAETN